ncbi:MAG TPA: bifunctional phosphopantothenoylcysteine decarboxylase/phosphopantothenate--cysteine ligase CoaBC [archaeon]|nr:bifunctional phosphopantothenoylcysteine decarboxylase/phosphopantothenate--cysteine ligase CoaBC [archaeon]
MGKTIVLGVTGSIASVRAFDLIRELRKNGFSVQVVASKASLELIGEKALEWAAGSKVISEISGKTEHIKFFGKNGSAELLLIAPATANTISKIAMGIDDTPITTFATTAIGSGKPVLLAPAMHEPMYGNPIVKKNLELLKKRNVKIIEPFIEDEKAKMENVGKIVKEVKKALGEKNFVGVKVLVANGATYSKIDPMRVITNLSSGKMGRAIAEQLELGGADISLIEGTEHTKFYSKIMAELENMFDWFVCPAAINDFAAVESTNKLSSGKKLNLELTPAPKLLQDVRKKYPKLKICAFKAETNKSKKELEKIGLEFLKKNKFQLVVVNDISKNPAGEDSSEMGIVSKKEIVWVKGTKEKIAEQIVGEMEKVL